MSLPILFAVVGIELALFVLASTHAVAAPKVLTRNPHWKG